MVRIFHNERPGADWNAVDPVTPKPHKHTCPRCHEQRECTQRFCARMGEGYIDSYGPHQPVQLMCDRCAHINKPFTESVIKSSLEIVKDRPKHKGFRKAA